MTSIKRRFDWHPAAKRSRYEVPLEAFGMDSLIELLSAGVLLWRLMVEASGQADEARIGFVERRAAWLMRYMLYGLALFVKLNSAYGWFITHHVPDPDA